MGSNVKDVDDPSELARFRREAQILASLGHPNVAAIYGLEESEGLVALAMELVPGEDLGKGVVHRDLKPANVELTPDGKVKVLDFGLAKAVDPPAGNESPADIARSRSIAARRLAPTEPWASPGSGCSTPTSSRSRSSRTSAAR